MLTNLWKKHRYFVAVGAAAFGCFAVFSINSVFELPGGWRGVDPLTVFSTPLTHYQIMYWGGSAIY